MSMDSTLPCYSGSYTLLAAFILVVWGILPFLVTCCCLKKYKSKGEIGSDGHDLLQDHYDEDADFRIKYGWAITKYRIKTNDADEERLDWFQNIVDEEFITHSGNKISCCTQCCKGILIAFVIVITFFIVVVVIGTRRIHGNVDILMWLFIIVGLSFIVSICVRCNCTGCCPAYPAWCGKIFVLNYTGVSPVTSDRSSLRKLSIVGSGSGNQTVTKTRGKKYGKCCRCL
jgi:hypothetical protein